MSPQPYNQPASPKQEFAKPQHQFDNTYNQGQIPMSYNVNPNMVGNQIYLNDDENPIKGNN